MAIGRAGRPGAPG